MSGTSDGLADVSWTSRIFADMATNLPWAHWNGNAVSHSSLIKRSHLSLLSGSLNMIAPRQAFEFTSSRRS